jgi:hypothetical protein
MQIIRKNSPLTAKNIILIFWATPQEEKIDFQTLIVNSK